MNEIQLFLENRINTKRAQKCNPIVITESNYMDNHLVCLAQYQIKFQYPNSRIAPSFIKLGIKDDRVCIRIDELERKDRSKFVDYFADDINHLKKLITHLSKLQRDYELSTWFLRAQLIPPLFKMVIDLFNKRSRHDEFSA